jgi:opacity protein-like surface antigen
MPAPTSSIAGPEGHADCFGKACRATEGEAMRLCVRIVAMLGVSIFLGPPSADAQGYVAPSLGVVVGNPSAQGRADFTADLGWLSRFEPIGFELDVMYAPSFFGNQGPYGQNSVTTVTGNIVVAGGGGGRYGFLRRRTLLRPYVSAGAGVMHEVVTTSVEANKISNNDLGLTLGAGVMAFPGRSIGVRGEVRYFRDLMDTQSGNTTNIDFGSFHFWRASIGVILAF